MALQTLDAVRAEALEALCELIVPGSSRVGPVVYVDAVITAMPDEARAVPGRDRRSSRTGGLGGADALAEHERTPEFAMVRALAIEAVLQRLR